jgi:hypothetical protein
MKDHLDESVAALTAAGVPEAEAAARAVSAFGRPERVASDFQTELARHQTARFALGLMTLPPVLTLLWMTILTTGPQAPWTESGEPIQLAWMDLVGSTAMKVALIVAIAANLAFWLPARARVARGLIAEGQRWATHLSVCGAATLGLSLMTILGYVAMRVYLAPWSLEWLDISVGTIITVGVLAALATRTRVTWQHFRASHLLATRAAE